MKKSLLIVFGVLLGTLAVWAGDGSPIPICQPGYCEPAVVKTEKAVANWVRNMERKPEIGPCFVDPNKKAGLPPNKPRC